jgi:hypothetical protein
MRADTVRSGRRRLARVVPAGLAVASVLVPLVILSAASPAGASWSPSQSIAPVTQTYGGYTTT